jgi:hypothetical protein
MTNEGRKASTVTVLFWVHPGLMEISAKSLFTLIDSIPIQFVWNGCNEERAERGKLYE